MAHTESRWRGSAEMIESSARSHAGAASGEWTRMSTASRAAAAVSDQRYRSAGVRSPSAAACSRQRTAATVCCCQKLPDSVPSPASAHSAVARIIAVWGRSQPRTGDQRSVDGTPVARPWGSNTANGAEAAAGVRWWRPGCPPGWRS